MKTTLGKDNEKEDILFAKMLCWQLNLDIWLNAGSEFFLKESTLQTWWEFTNYRSDPTHATITSNVTYPWRGNTQGVSACHRTRAQSAIFKSLHCVMGNWICHNLFQRKVSKYLSQCTAVVLHFLSGFFFQWSSPN